MSDYEILKDRLREAPSTEWSDGMLCMAADAIENLENQVVTLRCILSHISDAAAVYERQVGHGPLVENIRYGFEKLGKLARQEPGHDQLWQAA